MRSRSQRKPQKGVALIEALVSTVIFSFGLLGLIGLEARAIDFSVNAEDRNRAALLANDIASTMWLSGSVNLTPAMLAQYQNQAGNPTAAGLPHGTVAINPVAGSTNSADITITWKAPNSLSTDPANRLTTRITLP